MTKDAEIRKMDVPVEVPKDDKIIAEGIIEPSAVHIGMTIASIAALIAAVLVLSHVRFSIFATLCLLAFIIATIGMFLGLGANGEIIRVTKTHVLVKNVFGKEAFIHAKSVTAVGVSALNTIHVMSDACKMKCMFVQNSDEIVSEIRKLIEENAKD